VTEGFGANAVEIIDTATNSSIAVKATGADPNGVELNPAGTRFYVVSGTSNIVSVFDTATNNLVDTIKVCGAPVTATTQFIGPAVVSPAGFASAISCSGAAPPGLPNDPSTNQQTAAEPISTGNGNYYYQHTDFVIPGRGLPLVLRRSYSTLDNYSGPLGANWTHSYNVLLQDNVSSVNIKWGDGHGDTFTLSGTTYIPQAGVFSMLTKNGDGSFTLTQKNQTRYNFSAADKLTSIQDRNGNTVALTYDGSGNLIQVTDAVGRNLTLSYDGSNRISQVSDPIGRTVSFQYDGNNNLSQVTDSASGSTTFVYDVNHRVTSITQSNGQTLLQNTYYASGRVMSQTGGRGFATTLAYNTPNLGDTTITDARGKQTIHGYDSSLRIVKITSPVVGHRTAIRAEFPSSCCRQPDRSQIFLSLFQVAKRNAS
jgi:YVTN family beta-propeller protein/YD repeat-containing protein